MRGTLSHGEFEWLGKHTWALHHLDLTPVCGPRPQTQCIHGLLQRQYFLRRASECSRRLASLNRHSPVSTTRVSSRAGNPPGIHHALLRHSVSPDGPSLLVGAFGRVGASCSHTSC